MSKDATPLAQAAFADAIASCAAAWKDRWARAPTVNELAHAFETCLSANPDRYVADVGSVLAAEDDAPRPGTNLDAEGFDVVFRDEGRFGVPEVEFYAPKVEKKPGWGEVQAHLEVRGDTLVVDVEYEPHRKVPSFALACELVQRRALHRWIGHRDLRVTRVVLRPLAANDPSFALPWPPPDA